MRIRKLSALLILGVGITSAAQTVPAQPSAASVNADGASHLRGTDATCALGLDGSTSTTCALDAVELNGAVSDRGVSGRVIGYNATGPGLNQTNVWRTSNALIVNSNTNTQGIAQGINVAISKHSEGDICGFCLYLDDPATGGIGADEAASAMTLHNSEQGNNKTNTGDYYKGTATATVSVPYPASIPLSASTSSVGFLNTGLELVKTSVSVASGHITGTRAVAGTAFLNEFSVDNTLTLNNAWATVTDAITGGATENVGVPQTHVLTLHPIPGSANSFVNGLGCYASPSNFKERVPITVSAAASGGTQTVSFTARHNSVAGAQLVQGPDACTDVSLDANLAFSGMMTSYLSLGALSDTGHLAYVFYVQGAPGRSLPQTNEAATFSSPNNGYHLFDGAEIVNQIGKLSLTNPNFHTLEPSRLTAVAGDTFVNPHFAFNAGNAFWIQDTAYSPANDLTNPVGFHHDFNGMGRTGPYQPMYSRSNNPASWFCASGAAPCVNGVTFWTVQALFHQWLHVANGPEPSGCFICVDHDWAGTDTTAGTHVFLQAGIRGPISYDPGTGSYTLLGPSSILGVSSSSGDTTFSGGLQYVGDHTIALSLQNKNAVATGGLAAKSSRPYFGARSDGQVGTLDASGNFISQVGGYQGEPAWANFGKLSVGGSAVCTIASPCAAATTTGAGGVKPQVQPAAGDSPSLSLSSGSTSAVGVITFTTGTGGTMAGNQFNILYTAGPLASPPQAAELVRNDPSSNALVPNVYTMVSPFGFSVIAPLALPANTTYRVAYITR